MQKSSLIVLGSRMSSFVEFVIELLHFIFYVSKRAYPHPLRSQFQGFCEFLLRFYQVSAVLVLLSFLTCLFLSVLCLIFIFSLELNLVFHFHLSNFHLALFLQARYFWTNLHNILIFLKAINLHLTQIIKQEYFHLVSQVSLQWNLLLVIKYS